MDAAFLLLLGLSGLSTVFASAKWSYEGQSGPKYWHQMYPAGCSGKEQSPIDIRAEETMYDPALKDFAIWYDPPRPGSNMTVSNNGHTVKVAVHGDFYVSNGGLDAVYKVAQFHFHWGRKNHVGSEHLMESKHSPIELHIVSYNHERFPDLGAAAPEKGGLAVLGVMFELTEEDNPAFANVVSSLKHIQDPEQKTSIVIKPISLRDLLPKDISRYYRYAGSLTTPGCHESVTWTVFDAKQTLSYRQMKEFRKLLQFRRHQHQQDKAAGRHRRSLTQDEKHAQDLFAELDIKDEKIMQDMLEAQLSGQRHTKREDSHSGTHANEVLSQPSVEEDMQYLQDPLVDNYRPVQPINDRVVYRSFKLREPLQHYQEGEVVVEKLPQASLKCDNSARSLGQGHFVTLGCLFVAICAVVVK